MRLLQASRFLDGRTEVGETDLAVLTAVLWDSTAERPTVEREVLQLINPASKEALDLADAIDELEAQLDAKAGQWLGLATPPARHTTASGTTAADTAGRPVPTRPTARCGSCRRAGPALHRRCPAVNC